MLARIAYMIFLTGGAVWLWSAQLSERLTWILGFGAVMVVFMATDTTSRCSCGVATACRRPSARLALCFACLGVGLGAWSIAHGGIATIAERWEMESVGRLLAWPAVIFIAPFASLALEAKQRRLEHDAAGVQRTWERDDWKGG